MVKRGTGESTSRVWKTKREKGSALGLPRCSTLTNKTNRWGRGERLKGRCVGIAGRLGRRMQWVGQADFPPN